jgi:hypothetical protein
MSKTYAIDLILLYKVLLLRILCLDKTAYP